MTSKLKPPEKVLLIGWDAADWKIIHPLMDAGKMPNLEKFVTSGVMGNLATQYPDLSPMLWTSIATGKRPFKHGVHGFTEPDPDSGGIRPITNLSRKTKALWNILCQNGKKCNVIAWWPSHPVEPVNGVMVSNHYQRAFAPLDNPWPIRPGTVHPQRLVRNLAELRVHPQELDPGLVMNFVPRLAEIDQEKDHRIEGLAKIIADTTTVCKAATAVMHHEPWDFTAVYFDGIDHFCHGYMTYHPPRLEWVNEKDYELFKLVVESGYIYHDFMLGDLLKETDDETLVMLVSDHGFQSDHLRPRHVPMEPAGPAAQHRHYGIIAMKGPGVLRDETVFGASQLDVCPTILAAVGLPVGQDMDGKPLVSAFQEPPDFKTIPGWDEVPGEDGSHPPDMQVDPIEAQEAINQLVALGYIEEPPEDREKAVENTVCELQYNLARSYMDADRHTEAMSILDALLKKWPDEHRFGIQLITCHEAVGSIREARPILEEMFRRKDERAARSVEKLKALNEKHKETEIEDLSDEERREFRKLRAGAGYNPHDMEYLMGSLLFAEENMEQALEHLRRSEKTNPGNPGLHNKIGDVYMEMERFEDARKSFENALSLDPENANAYLGLCRSGLRRGMYKKAAHAAMESVGLQYSNPRGHFLLGKALVGMGRYERAAEAMKVAITQNPNFPEACEKLAVIYDGRLPDPSEAERYRKLAGLARERLEAVKLGTLSPDAEPQDAPESVSASASPVYVTPVPEKPADPAEIITIVTGLPRSGTSMMMQMLEAGGIHALTDGQRKADEDNPRGYFEFDKAAKLRTDRSWLEEAKGKAVKIVAQLLNSLPRGGGFEYRVIFMERDPDEVLLSQRTMLKRKEKTGAQLSDEKLKEVFAGQTSKVVRMLSGLAIPTLHIDYNKSVTAPEQAAQKVNAFLGERLDEKAMAASISPALYRHRA
ncbi:alkaline phosphatase family protein [Desulfococcaceae bacterium HSG7]|nr:alkaline phosphatase family protein [Desulfococcaceae bacterium HSG7]